MRKPWDAEYFSIATKVIEEAIWQVATRESSGVQELVHDNKLYSRGRNGVRTWEPGVQSRIRELAQLLF